MKAQPDLHSRSSLSFRDELEIVLRKNRIVPDRLPVTAEGGWEENWQHLPDDSVRQKVGKVIIYMEEHLSEELSLDRLAKEIDLSKYQLIRGFRKEAGITPWQFLIQKRIEKVKELLEQGMSPGQAAVESGFYDQSHMNKAFRDATGLTPKEYQEENFRNTN